MQPWPVHLNMFYHTIVASEGAVVDIMFVTLSVWERCILGAWTLAWV